MRRLAIGCAGAALLAACCVTAEAAARKDNRVQVTVGEYRIEFQERAAWTFGKIYYGDTQVGLDNGWWGLVLTPIGGKWIGTGHTEGGQEKVLDAHLFVDGEEVALTAGAKYTGKAARLEKRSMVDKLALRARYEITPEGIAEEHAIEATEDEPVATLYAFMHIWTTATKQWIAETAGGKIIQGEFKSNPTKGKGDKWPLRHDVRWTGVYAPEAKTAMVLCYPELYKGKGIRTGLWDLARYHKQYYQPYKNETLAKGAKRTFRCRVWCLKAEPDTWAETVAASVKARIQETKAKP